MDSTSLPVLEIYDYGIYLPYMAYMTATMLSFEKLFLIYSIMKMIERYDRFFLEMEFQKIVSEFHRILESGETVRLGDTMEWDIKKGLEDKPAQEMEWNFDAKKSRLQSAKDKIKGFQDWLQRGDDESGLGIDHPIIGKIRSFIEKVKDPERIRQYFHRLISEVKSFPASIKKDILKKICMIIIAYIPVADLITPASIEKDPVLAEVKSEIEAQIPAEKKESPIRKSDSTEKNASFDGAQTLVKTVEAGYSSDRNDTGNWINVPGGGQRFIGTNHGISAPVLQDYFKDKGIKRIISKQDMMDLTYETALEIYKKDYWDAQGLENFKSQSIANVLYDGCVNQGSGAMLGVLKKSMEKIGYDTDSIGSWGEFHKELTPKVNEMTIDEKKNLFEKIKDERVEKYKKAETWKNHGRGWIDRVDKITFIDNTKDSNLA